MIIIKMVMYDMHAYALPLAHVHWLIKFLNCLYSLTMFIQYLIRTPFKTLLKQCTCNGLSITTSAVTGTL